MPLHPSTVADMFDASGHHGARVETDIMDPSGAFVPQQVFSATAVPVQQGSHPGGAPQIPLQAFGWGGGGMLGGFEGLQQQQALHPFHQQQLVQGLGGGMHGFASGPSPPAELLPWNTGQTATHGFMPFVRRSQSISGVAQPAAPMMGQAGLVPVQMPHFGMGDQQGKVLFLGKGGGVPMPFGMAGPGMALPTSQQHFPGEQEFGDMDAGGARKRSAETLRKRCASQRSRRVQQADLWARLDSLVPESSPTAGKPQISLAPNIPTCIEIPPGPSA